MLLGVGRKKTICMPKLKPRAILTIYLEKKKKSVSCFTDISRGYILWKGRIFLKVWQQHKNATTIKKKCLLHSTFLKGSQLANKQAMYWTGYEQIRVLTKTFAIFSTEHLGDIHSNNYSVLWILSRETALFQKICLPKIACSCAPWSHLTATTHFFMYIRICPYSRTYLYAYIICT